MGGKEIEEFLSASTMSSAIVERGFNCMKELITYARNSLLSSLAVNSIIFSLNKDINLSLI